MGNIDLGQVGIWTGLLDLVPSSRAIELAAEVEEMGYRAIWIPEAVGRDPFVAAALLLQGTSSIKVATGIANIYARDPMTTANAQRTVEEAFPGRFLLGLGVSHRHLVQDLRRQHRRHRRRLENPRSPPAELNRPRQPVRCGAQGLGNLAGIDAADAKDIVPCH